MVPTPHLRFSEASPSPAILNVLGVLRRRPTTEELAPVTRRRLGGWGGGPPGVLTVFRRYVRIVHGPAGMTSTIVTGLGQLSLPKSALYPCMRAVTRELLRLLRGQPRDVQRDALRIQRSYKLGPQTLGVHPWLNYIGGGGTGGPFDLRGFRTGGIMIEGGGNANGLVPDGVATVTLNLAGQTHHPLPWSRAVNYYRRHPYTSTATVIENAFFFPNLPADPSSAARQTITWRNSRGHILRVTR
jgi:hypothetical protein